MKHLNRWVYAIIGVIVLLLAGLVYAWSVISQSISAWQPTWTAQQLSITFTLVMAFFCIGVLLAGIFSNKISPKIYVLCSGIFFFIGFFVASLTGDTPALLYLGFGILCGLGAGFAYNAVMSTMSQWFPDRQGLISGILLMGFGLSSFIIGNVFTAVTPIDGSDAWKTTFRVLGIIIAVVMVICCFFFVKPGPDYKPGDGKTEKKAVREPATELNTGQMVRRPSFWFYYLWAIFVSAAGLALVSQGSGIATEVGTAVGAGVIATVVGLISIFNGIGRVIFGALFDRVGHRITMLLDMAIFIVAAVILILALRTGSFALIIVGFIFGGLGYGGVTPTNSALISDFFGREHYSLNFSLINTNLLIASFASTIAGRLYDNTQSYMATNLMMIVVVVIAFVVFFGVRRPKPATESETTASDEAAGEKE